MTRSIRTVFIAVLIVVFAAGLCGCSLLTQSLSSQNSVKTLNDWQFQHNDGTSDYSVFFAFHNEKDKEIASDAIVEIRIVDEEGNELYKATRKITKDDFGSYTSTLRGEQYLANIRIPESEVKKGVSTSGIVYLKVYKANAFEFDEVKCEAHYCLPVKSVTVVAEKLPYELALKDYNGKTESKIRIEEISSSFKSESLSNLGIKIIGTKTYGNKSTYDAFGYKLYDSQGYVVDSGIVMLSGLEKGDKFKDETINYYDAIPGETYTIKFSEKWH